MHKLVTVWDTFGTVAGAAAGALVGLLFVAVSIRIDVIAASTEVRNRAAQTLGLFSIVLLIGIVLAIPAQERWVVGAEMALLAVAGGTTFVWLDRRARKQQSGESIARVLDAIAPNTFTCVLLLAAAGFLVVGVSWGMYILAATTVVASVGGIISSWLLLTRVATPGGPGA